MLVLVAMATLLAAGDAARILALLTIGSHSHHIFNRALMVALAARGHQVTVFTPDLEKRPVPNLREVFIEDLYTSLDEEIDLVAISRQGPLDMLHTGFEWGRLSCQHVVNSRGARQLLALAANETFDLVVVESALNECVLGFVPAFGSPPLVAITAYGSPPWGNHLVGNELNPAYVNTFSLPYTDRMTFCQRATNWLFDWYIALYRRYVYMPQQDAISRNFFGEASPLPSEIEKNISLLMVNYHFSIDYPRPNVPAVIPIGGLQTRPAKPLPADIKKYLDESANGVIYFSLGSNLRSDKLDHNARRALMEAFAELPVDVLWKWESDDLPGKPDNVRVMKWLPQNDILAHPKVLLFLTHCGMLSTHEAVYHGVPMVGMPFFLDQHTNMHKNVQRGIAAPLDIHTISKQSVLDAINTVLNNSSYRERAQKLSAIYRDRPQTALETSVFWTEYALRHKGAPHLRCAARDLSWPQRTLLDVAAAVALALFVLWRSLLLLLSLLRCRKEKTE